MVRLIVLAVLLAMSVWEWFRGLNKALYVTALLGLFVFFTLRYGQGTDYLNYLSIYATIRPLNQMPSFFGYQFNKVEIGYFYLCSFFRMVGFPFTAFIGVVTLSSLLLLDRFIRRYSPLPTLSLTLFYAVYSLTYMESGIRQMLAIAIALGWVLVDWPKGRRVSAILGVLLAATLHMSVLLLLCLPVLFWSGEKNLFTLKTRSLAILGALVVAAAAVINFAPLGGLIARVPGSIGSVLNYYYTTAKSFAPLALVNRTLFMALACALAWRAKARLSAIERFLMRLYILGFAVYLLTMSVDVIASRTNVYFRVLEIALLPALLYRNRDMAGSLSKWASPLLAVCLAAVSFLYVKDMKAIMGFSGYYSDNVLQYPYVTLFEPTKLLSERYIPVKYEPYMNQAAYGQFDFDEYYRLVQRKPQVSSPWLPY